MLTHGERQSYQVGNFISNIMFKFSYPYKLRNTRMKWPDVQVSSAAHSLPGTHLRCMQVLQDSSLKRLTPLSIIWFCLHNVFSSTSPRENFCLHHYLIPGFLTHCVVFYGLRNKKTLAVLSSQNQRKRERRKNIKERLSKVLASCKGVAGLFTVSPLSSSPLQSITLKAP